MKVLGISGRGCGEGQNDAETGENKSNNLFHNWSPFALVEVSMKEAAN
jgi:hypothetical protein